MDFISNPYRGPANIPHVSEDFFKMFFVGSHVAFTMLALPGRFAGTEFGRVTPNRDYIRRVCEANAVQRDASRGKIPKFYYRKPAKSPESWPHMWWKHIHHKSWAVERSGPLYPSA
ncbi:hypothetical protein BSKO_00756 [Bryopsis sp. KO-2023]|nr:hypothetical protein BSKO_00756 [Bryopsis sp. KO-2023]